MALFYGVIAVFNAIVLGKAELCFFRMICGLPCPGCGLTHSTFALLTGDIKASLSYCPLTVFMLATIVGSLICYFNLAFLPRPIFAIAHFLGYNRRWHLILCVSFALLYVARMILYFPNGPYPMVYNQENYLAIGFRLLSKAFAFLVSRCPLGC